MAEDDTSASPAASEVPRRPSRSARPNRIRTSDLKQGVIGGALLSAIFILVVPLAFAAKYPDLAAADVKAVAVAAVGLVFPAVTVAFTLAAWLKRVADRAGRS